MTDSRRPAESAGGNRPAAAAVALVLVLVLVQMLYLENVLNEKAAGRR